MAPPCGLTKSASSLTPSWRRQAMPCEAKASLSSIKSKSDIFRPSRSISLRVAGTGPMPMTRGGTAAENAGPRLQSVLLHGGFGSQDHRGRTVIDAGRVARGHGAGLAHDRLQF